MTKLLLFGVLAFGLNAFGQVPSYVPTNGLVGWWPFNGNPNDESGNGNNATNNGATLTNDRFSNPNSAYSFDGIDDFLSLASGAGSQLNIVGDISCSFWLNTSQTTPFGVITIGDNVGVDGGFLVDQIVSGAPNNNPDKVSIWTANQWISSETIWNDGITNFFCITLESGVLKLFKNGSLDTTIINQPSVSSYSGNRFFGVDSQGNNGFLNGVLDDIGIWDRAITACEIQDLYNAQLNSTSFPVTQNGAQLTVDQTGATYQWLDCDNNFAIINGETNQSYTPAVTGNYAVEVNMNGCVDTSACFLVDYTGIEELIQSEKELVKIIDFMGRETEIKPNTPLIFIYSDGTRERIMKLEE